MRILAYIFSGACPLIIGVLAIFYTNPQNNDATRSHYIAGVVALMVIGLAAIVALAILESMERDSQKAHNAELLGNAKKQLEQAERSERLRITNEAIHEWVAPKTASALNSILGGYGTEGAKALAREMFNGDLRTSVNERPEPFRSYMEAVGHYDNLLDRISAYSEAKLIDEGLFFSQYEELVFSLYYLLAEHVWENPKMPPRTRITEFAVRAFLHYVQHSERPSFGDMTLSFYGSRARDMYPGPETEAILATATVERNKAFFNAYGEH